MGNAADAATLAKSFEPILLFHKDEAFFPIDPKWYLERCALWKTARAFDDKTKWAQPPGIAKGMIAALPGAKEIAGGKIWIGAAPPGDDFGIGAAPIGEQPAPNEEHFLEFVGWEPVATPPVTPSTNNRHAALQPNEYTLALQASSHWYYVEYLDNTDLQHFTDNPNIDTSGLKLFTTVATNPNLGTPRMILYHLLYPLHQETLEGCEDAGEGRLFGSYAGEWACIAILMDAGGKPSHIGLTSRNTGTPSTVSGEDRRIGMTIFKWTDAAVVTDATGGMHPKIFVSLDTHGHYLKTGSMPLKPFTPSGLDPSRQSCGEVEGLDDAIKGDITIPGAPGDPGEGSDWGIVFGKLLVDIATVGIATSPVIDWINGEGAFGKFGSEGTPDTLKSPDAMPVDVTGGPDFGRIIRPKALGFPETAHAAALEDWNVHKYTAPNPDGRAYDFIVDRSKQIWWVPRPTPRPRTTDLPNPNGFSGRWGPRVTNDPNSRRAGGKLPDFALQFMEALTVFLSK